MKTVFHINSGEALKQSELLGNIQNLMDDQTVEIEEIAVVINSNAIDMVEEGSEAEEFIEEFLEKGVGFNACSNSLENRGIGKDEVIEGVEITSSGVGRLIELQDEGFNYVKI